MSLKLIRTPLSLVLAGCLVTAFSAQADIVIGVAGPFTGPNATYGDQYWHGATQAAEDINAAGGINGEKIKLVQGDDACEPKQAVAVANRLVDQDKVNAVVGHFCSSSTMPASEVYSDAGIITITPGSTNPLITERGMNDMFRMCGRDDQQGGGDAEAVKAAERLGFHPASLHRVSTTPPSLVSQRWQGTSAGRVRVSAAQTGR